MRFLSSSILLCVLAGVCVGQNASTPLRLGFVHIQTSREADTSRVGSDMAPDLVVRLSGTGREVFAFSGGYGSVVVPLRPGEYCVELFAKDGHTIRLSAKEHPNEQNCFRIGADEYLEFDAVAAYDPEVKVLPPPPKRR